MRPHPEGLVEWLRDNATAIGLESHFTIYPIVNPSGWLANVACTVRSGERAVHVKLSQDRAAMERVYALRDALTARHRMPEMLAWIDLEAWSGFAMRSIDTIEAPESLIPDLCRAASTLHADSALAALLPSDGGSMRDAFLDLWIARFRTDIRELEGDDRTPPFVTRDLWNWMCDETERLAAMATGMAFDEPRTFPVHSDLHLGNVLLEPSGSWWIIDWDSISLGDPANEFATLLRPFLLRGDRIAPLISAESASFRERFSLAARAAIFDMVLDPLDDWARADTMPEVTEKIRNEKRILHETALAMYRKLG